MSAVVNRLCTLPFLLLGTIACSGKDTDDAPSNLIRCHIDGRPFKGTATGVVAYEIAELEAEGTVDGEAIQFFIGVQDPSVGSHHEGPLPGVADYVRVLRESGAELALWGHPDEVDGLISELDVDDYGDGVISGTFSATLADIDDMQVMEITGGRFEVELNETIPR